MTDFSFVVSGVFRAWCYKATTCCSSRHVASTSADVRFAKPVASGVLRPSATASSQAQIYHDSCTPVRSLAELPLTTTQVTDFGDHQLLRSEDRVYKAGRAYDLFFTPGRRFEERT